ncbi:MAG: sigma-70 family RNA polymerase sigma factor [Candidatus Dormibacteraeota bacterium]|nr:sigma-70 family RNA polymerase sigma factor [Candidatus Dormibacteraeota bacterium]
MAQGGNVEAFTELVLRYQDMAFAAALAMVGDFGLAQDAVQESFLAAYLDLSKLRASEAFAAWMRQIVRHHAARLLRKRHFETVSLGTNDPSIVNPMVSLESKEDARRIVEAIDALPPVEREVTILYYLRDRPQREVAALLDLPVTTVNNRLHAARNRLKGELLPLMKAILSRHALHGNFADRVGEIIRVEAGHLSQMLAELGAGTFSDRLIETGIKVLDLLCPIGEGGTVGVLGDVGVGKLVLIEELAHNLARTPGLISVFTFVRSPDEVELVRSVMPKATGSLPTIYLALEDATEPALTEAQPYLDVAVFMSRQLISRGIYPAVDPRRSSSRLLDQAVVGPDHIEVARRVREALAHLDDRGPAGERARRIQNFLSQPFFVAEPFTKRPGTFVPRKRTIEDFRALLNGTYDQLPEEAFLMCGTLDDAIARAQPASGENA